MSLDFIALKTITTIKQTKAATRRAIVRQPAGTNHFQFLVHQLPCDSDGIGGVVGSIRFSYEPLPADASNFIKRGVTGGVTKQHATLFRISLTGRTGRGVPHCPAPGPGSVYRAIPIYRGPNQSSVLWIGEFVSQIGARSGWKREPIGTE
jgi:hypothetical protein